MDQRGPFTRYGFWAYLSAGFLLMFGIDPTAGAFFSMREDWTVAQVALAIFFASRRIEAKQPPCKFI